MSIQDPTIAIPATAIPPSFAPSGAEPRLEPVTQAFIDSLAGAPPTWSLSPQDAHDGLTALQSQPVPLMDAEITDTVWPVGPLGARACASSARAARRARSRC